MKKTGPILEIYAFTLDPSFALHIHFVVCPAIQAIIFATVSRQISNDPDGHCGFLAVCEISVVWRQRHTACGFSNKYATCIQVEILPAISHPRPAPLKDWLGLTYLSHTSAAHTEPSTRLSEYQRLRQCLFPKRKWSDNQLPHQLPHHQCGQNAGLW